VREIPFDPAILVDLAVVDYEDDDPERQEILDRIASEVEALPGSERGVMECLVWGRMTRVEAARHLNLSRSYVHKLEQRAKAVLRERLGDLVQ